MRLLLALAAALALAGCQVALEGAACSAPGSGDQCPSDQRCGNDLRCSARAASCATTRCTPGERRCVDGDVRSCQASDPICGAWQVDVACAVAGLECGGSGAEAACSCPANGGAEVVVDAEAGEPAGAPAATGVRSPAACRFATLQAGLAAARAGVAPLVVVAGPPGVYPVTATLAIPAGVTLRGDDDPPAPASRVLSLEGSLAAGVTLAEGATLSGITVRNGTAAATSVGVEIACAAGTSAARLTDVVVQAAGAPALVNGVRAAGACPVELTRVTIQGASEAGLLVARDGAETLLATEVVLDANGEGLKLTRGDVTLARPVVKASAGTGIEVKGEQDQNPPYTRYALLTIDQGSIRGNGDTGVAVVNAGRLHLTGTRMCGNGAKTFRGAPYLAAAAQRKVGGLFLFGNPPSDLAFQANALFSNAGDQVLVAGGAWTLDGAPAGATACGAGVNLLDAYAPADGGVTYVGLYAASAAVTALWNAWPKNLPPQAGIDYAAGGTGSVDAGTSVVPNRFCTWLAAAPTCD